MAGPAWNDDVSSTRVEENLVVLAVDIVTASLSSRDVPTVDIVLSWHRQMLVGTDVPDDAYRGALRGSAHPALADYEVNVDGLAAARAADVVAEVDRLVAELQRRVSALDALDQENDKDELAGSFVEAVIDTAAWLHGEWVRIHPLVNGNGRMARAWVLWLCARYGLPELLPLRPRPDMGYGPACSLSMIGDHSLFRQYLLVRYNSA